MTSYNVRYVVKSKSCVAHREGDVCRETVDAKDLKSAKHKIETKLAKIENRYRIPSKQLKVVKIEVLDYSINGYY